MGIRRTKKPSSRSGSHPQYGLARVLSKLGVCSRSEAVSLIEAGRVTVNSRKVHRPEQRVPAGAQLRVDGQPILEAKRTYLALNKPRGLVTTRSDEKGRATVFDCFAGAKLPHLAPVGRLGGRPNPR